METTIGQRLKAFIDFKGLKNAEFARTIGTGKQKIDYWISNSGITIDWLSKIMEVYPDLNVDWLLLGTGKMVKNPAEILPTASEPEPPYGDVDALLERIKLLEENISLRKIIDDLSKK